MSLFIFVDDTSLSLACSKLNIADEERYLVILVEVVPEHICELIDIAAYANELRLSLKAWERIAVTHVGVDESSFTGDRIAE